MNIAKEIAAKLNKINPIDEINKLRIKQEDFFRLSFLDFFFFCSFLGVVFLCGAEPSFSGKGIPF